jgi:hypothetical protein
MAGSFDIFRKYQRSLLVAVAILAMLAFFVLPPFLQLGSDVGSTDPVVASWRGGEVSESGLMRAVAMRSVLNQFLRDAIAASGRDPGRMQPLPEDEQEVVRTQVLAREAADAGIVVSNAAINEFLSQWTNDMVGPAQFEALIAGRRLGNMAVSQGDVFEALRTVLAANRMERMFFGGLEGDPPGLLWDRFRRLEQEATVEVVPVVVESFAAQVSAPGEETLRPYFARYRDELPESRNPDPGFKTPHRISCAYLVAKRDSLEAEAAKDVTDEQVQKFYDDNKDRFYREKPKAAAAAPADAAVPPAAVPAETNEQPAAAPAEANEKPAAEPAGAEDTPQSQPEKQAEEKEPQSRVGRSRFMLAAFRQPAAADAPAAKTEPQPPAAPEPAAAAEPATTAAAPPEPASKPDAPATKPDAPATKPDAPAPETTGPKADEKQEPAPGAAAAAEKTEVAYEPLDAVKDDVRKRLAGEAANRRIDAVFAAVTADVARYAEDLALWRSQGDATIRAPEPPDVEAIAKRQGLEGATLERIEAVRALAEAPVAATFQLAADPESPMGFRQLTWAELLYGRDAPMLRPVTTRDVAGNRYLSWKTDDQPAVAPEFAAARADVERAWRIVEARPLARKVAEEIAAQVQAGATLADAVAKRTGDPKLEIVKAGPFAWLSRGGASFGSAASLSQPDGLSMPGEEFMAAVFGLEPGGTAVAFNEPRTVCYCIRLDALTPPEDDLRKRFFAGGVNQPQLMAVTREAQEQAYLRWIADLERRRGLEWKRPPQRFR